ncbi:MAG: cell division protein ZipA C-terminal FtsZ-binding domain-containing protein [Methylococcales bacterium]
MDKELLRIVIIATGLMIIMGMLLWGYFKSQRSEENSNFFRDVRNTVKSKLANKTTETDTEADYPKFRYESSLEGDFDDFEDELKAAAKPAVDSTQQARSVEDAKPKPTQAQPSGVGKKLEGTDKAAAKQHLPRLIQFSIVAKTEQGFNGADLDSFFNAVGLQYGSVKIYERLDMERRVDFCVASMINPGTFPDTNLEAFFTPGITFFMQPQELPEPVIVFDDLMRTINLLAMELDGDVWDATRNLLTESALKTIRKSLQV